MLDGGPSRKLQSAERRADLRTGRGALPMEEARPLVSERQQSAQAAAYVQQPVSQVRKKTKRLGILAAIVAVFAALVIIGVMVWVKGQGATNLPIEKDKYQAVFLSGGQVYFGKLEILDASYIKLSEVFYIQSPNNEASTSEGKDPQSTNSDGGMQLIKLGEEVHGPEDVMVINRDQVLFYENLKPSGQVSQLIQNYKPGSK